MTLDLIAKIGGFETGMDRAARTADRKGREIAAAQRKAAKEAEDAWKGVGSAIAAGFAGVTVGSVFGKFVAETKQAEQEQAQLAAVLKSTGQAAGYSIEQLNAMAEAQAKASTFGAGDINQAQARLLSYTGVVGEQFPKAMQAAIDMATRMGMDVKQSAETVGKALDSPKDGLSALSKQGFRFTEDQKALVENLQETGRTAEAQGIILQALESSYGGAASAARDTFGGSISALKENINDLLTGDEGSMAKMKQSVEDLNAQLTSSETKQAFQTLTGLLADVVSGLVNATSHFVSFGRFAGEALAKWAHGSADPIERMDESLIGLREEAAALNAELNKPKKGIIAGANDGTAELSARLAEINKQIANTEQLRADMVRAANNAPPATGVDLTPHGFVRPPSSTPKPKKEAADPAEKAAAAYIRQLNDQIGKVGDLTTAERVLFDLQTGKITLTHAQKEIAFGLAQEIDRTKELAAQKKADLELTVARISAQREFNETVNQYARTLSGVGMGTQARTKGAGFDQIEDKYSQDLGRLEDRKREAIYDDKWTDKAEARYNEELALILDFKAKALNAYEGYWQELTAKQGDWTVGAHEATVNYLNEAANIAGQTEDLVGNAFKGMEDALTQFTLTGKLDFKSLATSVISDLARMQAKAAITGLFGGSSGGSGILGNLISSISGLFGGTPAAGGSSSLYSLGSGSSGLGLKMNALGGIYDSPGLSAYSNQVHSTPKVFAFAKGAGVFGEAGPEAIMPLSRGADGALGVRAVGSNPGVGDVFNIEITVDAGGSKVQGDSARGNQLATSLGGAVRAILLDEKRPGGILA